MKEAPYPSIESLLKNEPLTEIEWKVLWKAVLQPWVDANGRPAYLADHFYFSTLLLMAEAKTEAELLKIVELFAPRLDANSQVILPYIAQQLLANGQWQPIWTAFLEAAQIIGPESYFSYTREQHLAEICNPENDASKRLWAVETIYPQVQIAADSEYPIERNNRWEINAADAINFLMGFFEMRATDHLMLNEEDIQYEHFTAALKKPSNHGLDAFTVMMYLLGRNVYGLKFPIKAEQVEKIFKRGLLYIKQHLPEGMSVKEFNDKYPLIVEWLNWRLEVVDEENLRLGMSRTYSFPKR